METDMSTKKPEILAPAGSYDAMTAAVYAGADAVYLGSTLFNARMNAKNFTREDIKNAVEFCHKRGVKVYVTINTAITDKQIRDAMLLVQYLYKTGVDALIVADLGFASEIHKYFPDFPLHASTQASGHSSHSAKYLKDIGFSRMVIARETSKKDLALAASNSPIELEVFVHGALCVSCSGQCLFSSIVGGRSGNRGECAQPCRLPYNSRYPLSLKDLSLANHITELTEMGIDSLKIEGRMKSPDYVYAVTKVFRSLVDENRNATESEMKYLEGIFSRSGFTDGYFTGIKDKNMLGMRCEGERIPSVDKTDCTPEREEIVIPERNHNLDTDFTDTYKIKRELPEGFKPQRSALFLNPEVIPEKKYTDYFDVIYMTLENFDPAKANGVIFPPTVYDSEYESVRSKLLAAKKKGAIHALVGNAGQFELAKECGFIIHGDYRLNIYSNPSAKLFEELDELLLSPELLLAQARDINAKKSIMVYGRIPLMTLEKPAETSVLTDRKKISFPIIEISGSDIVFNSVPTYMADKMDMIKAIGKTGEFFLFSTEGKREIENTIDSYRKGYTTKREIRRMK